MAPSYVVKGVSGGSVTQLYWPSHPLQSPATSTHHPNSTSHLIWKKSSPAAKRHSRETTVSQPQVDAWTTSSNKIDQALPAGSPNGSSSYGVLAGHEIRPALWASGTDPIVGPVDLAGVAEGDVVVEITIDEQGNVVQTSVLQSLGPGIDMKVVAALQQWRFHPATRDGIPIASEQDVYYHFPRRR